MPTRLAPRRLFAAAVLCGGALLASRIPSARAGDPAPMRVGSRAAVAPLYAADGGMRVDGRVSSQAVPTAYYADPRIASPTVNGSAPTPTIAIPYRVEPRDARPTPWDVPPEVPDVRDFEEVSTFDELANPHYEIREEIWNTPEDFITRDGVTGQDGIGYVPFWARNTIRWGRASIFPFAEVQFAWTNNATGGSRSTDTFEAVSSVGTLAEYMMPGGKTKMKAGARVDYHWYSDTLEDAFTYVGGLGFEHRISRSFAVDAGVEAERAVVLVNRAKGLAIDDDLVERLTLYGNFRYDNAFAIRELRLEAGGHASWNDELDEDADDGDYFEYGGYVRLSHEIMRHEGFVYAEYDYTHRDGEGVSSDLEYSHEVRVGVSGVIPHARTRRLTGNAYLGFAWDRYGPSDDLGAVGEGHDREDEHVTAGVEFTYRPSPYTSAFLGYHYASGFSTIANFNREHDLYLGVTQNLSNRLIGRLAASWLSFEPQDGDSSNRLTLGAGARYVLSDNVDLTLDYEWSRRLDGTGLDDGDSHRVALGATVHLR